MLSQHKDKILAVRGNCEAEVDQMVLPFPCLADYAIVLDGGITFYLTHGHHANPDNLPALEQGSIFLSGHTHVKMDEVRNGIRCVNPGSVSIPKDGTNSCMVWDNGVLRTVIWEE
jgi:putative phosphoesterase